MIELKLSQGAKPGHGGVLPGPKVTPEIAAARGVPVGVDCVSPGRATAPSRTPVRDAAVHRAPAHAVGRQADRLQALHRPPLGVVRHLQGDARDRHPARLHRRRRRRGRHRRRAARVHRPCRRAAAGRPAARAQHARRPEPAHAHQASAARARSSAPSTSRARWRWAPTGATPRAASCSRSAASRRRPATPAPAPPASPRRTRMRQRALVVPDKTERVYHFHQNTLKALKELVQAAGLQPPERDHGRAHRAPWHPTTACACSCNQLAFIQPGELARGDRRPRRVAAPRVRAVLAAVAQRQLPARRALTTRVGACR